MYCKVSNTFFEPFFISDDCGFIQACVFDDTLFVAEEFGDAVHMIDIRTRKKIETLPPASNPYGLHCLPWRKEVWVQLRSNRYSFQVIETEDLTRTSVEQTQPKGD